jgi:hypothetical protein
VRIFKKEVKMITFKEEFLGNHRVLYLPVQGGGRIYISNSAREEVEAGRIPVKGRIDLISENNYVLWVSPKDEKNYFLGCVSSEIAAGVSVAENQIQECGMFMLSRDAIFYCENKDLPIICRQPGINDYEYFLYGKGVFMSVSKRILDTTLSCPDIVWTTQCSIRDTNSEGSYNFKFYWFPAGDEKRLYLSNLFPPDLKDIPPIGVIREIGERDYVLYPFEGKENYFFPYKYYQYRKNGLSSVLSSIQIQGGECEVIKLGGKYGLLNRRLFLSSFPLVVIDTECSWSKCFLFMGETLDFSPEVFKIVCDNPSFLESCSTRTFYTIIKRPDVLLSTEPTEEDKDIS